MLACDTPLRSQTHLERLRLGNIQDVLVTLFVRDKQVLDPDLPEFDQCTRNLKEGDPGDNRPNATVMSTCSGRSTHGYHESQ